jgi:hypothetical protein
MLACLYKKQRSGTTTAFVFLLLLLLTQVISGNIHKIEEDSGTFLLRCRDEYAILKFESSKTIASLNDFSSQLSSLRQGPNVRVGYLIIV